ncbi:MULTISPECIES: hypothetical protein [unclassified Acinetobacter]|nr:MULTISPECIES: hypothetical protein [unclassified Acinetobacter]WOE32208.1 hypothetical protein QSG84_03055 [Acinetobacter sp. SAAs470]WOE37678.1 hypothetical protein QSG86_12100 [Acinetobacter sp. SAAs474]
MLILLDDALGHFAFMVKDIKEAVQYLEQQCITIQTPAKIM